MTKYCISFIFNTFSSFKNPELDTDALERNPKIFIGSPLMLLKLLRNFGHLIRNLGVEFVHLNAKICNGIEIYLVEYCSDSLQRFTFTCQNLRLFENLQKPFKKLIALKVEAPLDGKRNHYQFINDCNLPNLQYLFLQAYPYRMDQKDKIDHKNIEYLTIECTGINSFPFTFENLKYLSIYGMKEINDTFCEFIGKMQKLKIIRLMIYTNVCSDSLGKLFKLQNISTTIEEIRFAFGGMLSEPDSFKTIFRFIKCSRNLRKISFQLYDFEFRGHTGLWLQQLSLELSGEWKSCIISDTCDFFKYYVIEREIKC